MIYTRRESLHVQVFLKRGKVGRKYSRGLGSFKKRQTMISDCVLGISGEKTAMSESNYPGWQQQTRKLWG